MRQNSERDSANRNHDGNRNYSDSRSASLIAGVRLNPRESIPRERFDLVALVFPRRNRSAREKKRGFLEEGIHDSIKLPRLSRSSSEMFRAITSRCVSLLRVPAYIYLSDT